MTNVDELYNQAKRIVNEVLYESNPSETQIAELNSFLNNYYKLSEEHLYGDNSNNIQELLSIYEMVIDEAYNEYDNVNKDNYPAIRIIKEKDKEYAKQLENKMTKIRKLTNNNNYGFGTITFIVGSTIVLGIALGALLWFIK